MLRDDIEPRRQARGRGPAGAKRDPPDERDRRQHVRDRHDADRQLVIAADRDRQRVEPVAQGRLVFGQVAIEHVAREGPMTDVGVGRLVAVERLGLAGRHRPEARGDASCRGWARRCGHGTRRRRPGARSEPDETSASTEFRVEWRHAVISIRRRSEALGSRSWQSIKTHGEKHVVRRTVNFFPLGQAQREPQPVQLGRPRLRVDFIIRRRLERAPEDVRDSRTCASPPGSAGRCNCEA